MVRAVDCFLFSIIVLGCFTDRRGKLWRRKHSHLYMIELTDEQISDKDSNFATKRLLKLLPTQMFEAPIDAQGTVRECTLDYDKWSSYPYQLVYYYLKNFDTRNDDAPKFKSLKMGDVKKNEDFLQCIFW